MPSIFDSLTDSIRSFRRKNERRSSFRKSSRRASMRASSTATSQLSTNSSGNTVSSAPSAPPETPAISLNQPSFSGTLKYEKEEPNEALKYHTLQLQRSVGYNGTLARSGTLDQNESYDPNGYKNFWEIRGYKLALNRCDDGYELGNKLIDCISERAKIEDAYAKSLKSWNKKWSDYLNTESSEYQTGKNAWLALLQTGEEIATIHQTLSERLHKTPIQKIKTWLKEKYQKNIISFKQTKEFEDEFLEAQKSWKAIYDKIKKYKKEYHAATKRLSQVEANNRNIQSSYGKYDEIKKRKAAIEVETAKTDKERSFKRYADEIEQLKLSKSRYQENMEKVFDKTQQFEEVRMKHFKQIYIECHDLLLEQVKCSNYDNIFAAFLNQINQINHKNDLDWWSKNHGAKMNLGEVLPVFEECTP